MDPLTHTAAGNLIKVHNASTYRNHRCRCDDCRADWNAVVAAAKVRRAASASPDATHYEHGVHGYGNHGCRCRTCLDGHAAYKRSRTRQRVVASTPEPKMVSNGAVK